MKVLLVDDMEWVYENVKINLNDKYNISYANNKQKALNQAALEYDDMASGVFTVAIALVYFSATCVKTACNLIDYKTHKKLQDSILSWQNVISSVLSRK